MCIRDSSALTRPARQIVENAGEEGSVVVGKLMENPGDFGFGYDASTGEYKDLIAAGVLDPFKVVRTALQDASGVASLLTTSECCIVEAPEEKPAPMPGMGGGMGGMGGVNLADLFGAQFANFDMGPGTGSTHFYGPGTSFRFG